MSRDKQIEEMANIIRCNAEQLPRCPHTTCSICKATELYNTGYRKADEVAREIFEEMENTIKGIIVLLSFSYNDSPKESQLKKACYKDMLGYIAELKKKYTEEGK